jgi:hypothetical protein
MTTQSLNLLNLKSHTNRIRYSSLVQRFSWSMLARRSQ